MGTLFGYARCSTDESRQDIDRQKRELKKLGVEKDSNIYWEYESGTKKDRPELTKMLEHVQPGDTIAATEVSRLTRSTQQLCDILETVKEKHLRLLLGTMVIDCRSAEPDPLTIAMLQISGVFAQLEREMISQRVKSGLENARAKGKHVGRPKLSSDDIPPKFWKHLISFKEGKFTKSEFAKLMGVTRKTLYKWLDVAEAAES